MRDKLLGLENDDIDVALDNLSGKAFAQVLHSQLDEQSPKSVTVAVWQCCIPAASFRNTCKWSARVQHIELLAQSVCNGRLTYAR